MPTLISDTLILNPEAAETIRCGEDANTAVFNHPHLDISHDGKEPTALPPAELKARINRRTVAEQHAVRICLTCPILQTCREWALNNDVFGVAGGLTQHQRTEISKQITSTNLRTQNPKNIQKFSTTGLTNKDIAQKLGCSERTAARHRHRIKNAQPENERTPILWEEASKVLMRLDTPNMEKQALRTALQDRYQATGPLQAVRVTPETAALLNFLLDGKTHDREEIIKIISNHVSHELAHQSLRNTKDITAPTTNEYTQARRRVALNRIHILVRRGRIHQTRNGSTTSYVIDQNTALQWTEHLAAETNTELHKAA